MMRHLPVQSRTVLIPSQFQNGFHRNEPDLILIEKTEFYRVNNFSDSQIQFINDLFREANENNFLIILSAD